MTPQQLFQLHALIRITDAHRDDLAIALEAARGIVRAINADQPTDLYRCAGNAEQALVAAASGLATAHDNYVKLYDALKAQEKK